MKKKLLLVLSMALLLVCAFAISISAETVLKPQTSNAYGDLSFFDESVTVGRTNTKYGFTPYIDAEGTTYARIVVGDGTTFYTFPTAYALSNSAIYGEGERSIYHLDLTSLNNAVAAETGTNPGWNYKTVYRIELPYNMTYLNGGNNQAFKEYSNVIEIFLQPNTTTKDKNKQMLLFWNCKNLETIHNMDTFVFREGVTGGAFQNDAKLTNLTIGVSPEVTSTGDSMFSGCTNLQSVNLKEAFPNLKTVGKTCFSKCTNLTSTSSAENVVAFPDTLTTINQQAFVECKAIQYVSLPASLTKLDAAVFNTCTSLVFVDFNDNQNEITMSGYGTFRQCTSLKAICLPDNMKLIGDQSFTNCKALTAVYLPANLEIIKGNKGDGPAFGGQNSGNACKDLFFTNEKFEVRDENGKFYTAETFKVPAKPAIYYFPSTVQAITANHNPNNNALEDTGMIKSGGMSDCGIQWCPGINSILVLPEGYIGYSDQTSGNAILNENQRGDTLGNGLLPGCGTQESPLTVVFLGKIDRVSMDRKDGQTKYTTYVFANEANTGFENTKIGTWYNTSDTNYKNQDEMYVVFCHANNGQGAKYKVGFVGQEGNKTYPVLTTELQDGASAHIIDTNKNAVVSEANCTTDTLVNTFCFCGKAIDTNKEIAGTALGHEFDLEKGATKLSIVYANYLANGELSIKCARCAECEKSETAPIISEFKGFSVSEKGDGITFGYVFDNDAIAEFEAVNKCEVELGFVVAVKSLLGENAPLKADGEKQTDKVVKAAVANDDYTAADFVLRGTWEGNVTINEAEVDIKKVEFYMAGYMMINGSVVYLNSDASGNSAGVVTFEQASTVVAE